jgi:hypothetical protein
MARHSLLAGVLILLAAAPASATHGGIHPTFREERVYFHCTGPTKLYNVNRLVLTQPYITTWNATPPSQSVQQGAGCGGVEFGGFSNDVYDVAFQGTFTGNVRDLTIEIHQLLLGNARTAATETLRLNAWIDDKPLFPPGTQPTNGRTVTVTPVRSSSGASEKFVFSITNIGYANDVKDAQGNVIGVQRGGAALEDGDGTEEHTFLLYIGTHGNSTDADVKTKLGAWAWDTTEVPSGITFNPGTLAAAKVKSDLPVYP